MTWLPPCVWHMCLIPTNHLFVCATFSCVSSTHHTTHLCGKPGCCMLLATNVALAPALRLTLFTEDSMTSPAPMGLVLGSSIVEERGPVAKPRREVPCVCFCVFCLLMCACVCSFELVLGSSIVEERGPVAKPRREMPCICTFVYVCFSLLSAHACMQSALPIRAFCTKEASTLALDYKRKPTIQAVRKCHKKCSPCPPCFCYRACQHRVHHCSVACLLVSAG